MHTLAGALRGRAAVKRFVRGVVCGRIFGGQKKVQRKEEAVEASDMQAKKQGSVAVSFE